MSKIYILPSFERSIKGLPPPVKGLLKKSLLAFNDMLSTGRSASGLRFKKISQDVFEFRIDTRLRVVARKHEGDYYLILAGNHDEIRRYLRENG